MTTTLETWEAGVDAVIADATINKGGFADALRTVITAGLSDAEAKAWIDAVAVEYNRLGIINSPTYGNLRGAITGDGKVTALALFDALSLTLNSLPDAIPAFDAAKLLDLRDERDQINAAIDRCQALIDVEPGGTVGRLVKDVLRQGKDQLRGHRETVRAEIQRLTGDADS